LLDAPWQNGYAERLIGTVRRECLDRMLIFGEAHLRRILSMYAIYYNESRTHLSLHKDVPLRDRAVTNTHGSQPGGKDMSIGSIIIAHQIATPYCPTGRGGRGACSAPASGSWRSICSRGDNTPVS
jgi:hypothetical protein